MLIPILPQFINWGCKGTTKNAHLQTKLRKVYFQCNFVSKWAALCDRTFGGIAKSNRLSFFTKTIVFLARRRPKVQPCRLMRGLGPHIFRRRSLFFKKCERAVVCPASCERSYEMKKCLGWHFECSARQVPTWRISANIE